jgi:hypothetical protein
MPSGLRETLPIQMARSLFQMEFRSAELVKLSIAASRCESRI